jgi:hypothetical protein
MAWASSVHWKTMQKLLQICVFKCNNPSWVHVLDLCKVVFKLYMLNKQFPINEIKWVIWNTLINHKKEKMFLLSLWKNETPFLFP